ncbi:hypothetical protein [Erythrobacter sp. Alg231-14]|uniref:hypothetical protein n=1 Tax=Erythrobacter sp. Alg231-14 TaxID=1922225 RepID=UPI000D54DE4F
MEWMIGFAPFAMVIAIVWIANNKKLEEKRIDAAASQGAEKATQYAVQIEQLNERVQVLERIVTDRGYDVATQIEALRDVRQVEGDASKNPAQIASSTDTGTPLNIGKQEQV